jgi:hypothetical protein
MTAEAVHIPNATPFDLISEDADTFLTEARNWADGTAIETQAQADDVSRLIEHGRKLAKAADEARKEENRPHDDAKAKVQEKYAPLFADPKTRTPGRVFKAIDALKATLQPYLARLDAEKREAERKAREEAEAAAREAAEAMRQAAANDLDAREEAEAKVKAAEAAERAAKQAAADKAHATGGERAMGLRTVWKAEIVNLNDAVRWFWERDPAPFAALAQKLADDLVRAGRRGDAIPGVEIREEKVL